MRLRFRLRSLLLLLIPLCAVLAAVSIKLQQDFRIEHAMQELRAVGFNDRISAAPGHRTLVEIICIRPRFVDADVDRLLSALAIIQRSHDLGWSNGSEIALVDFHGANVSDTAIQKLRRALPESEIRR